MNNNENNNDLKKLGSSPRTSGFNRPNHAFKSGVGGNGKAAKPFVRKGAQALGKMVGGPAGGKIASKLVDSKPLQKAAGVAKKKLGGSGGLDRLRNTLANKVKNASPFSRFRKKNNSGSSGNEKEPVKDENQVTSPSEELGNVSQKVKKIKIIASILSFALPILGVLLLIILVVGALNSLLGPLASALNFGTSDFSAISEATSENYDKEIEYYTKLQNANVAFQDKCKANLKISYIHSSLIYLFYSGASGEENINYGKMSGMVDKIAKLMPTGCYVDYSIDGHFYNNLKNSNDFKNYYSELLKTESIDDILKTIFEMAGSINIEGEDDENFISNGLKVNVNNKLVSGHDYLLNSIYANVSEDGLKDNEKLKAYAILYSTKLVVNNDLSSNNQRANPIHDLIYCDSSTGCNGKEAISNTMKTNISSAINSVYGRVLTNEYGEYEDLSASNLVFAKGSNYRDYLLSAYPGYTIKNIGENEYVDADWDEAVVKTPVIFYDQEDYPHVQFCGRKGASISSSGCGVTAMAIVVSTYENSKSYDPVKMMQDAYSWKYCGAGISGTSDGFFRSEAKKMGYKYLNVKKSNKSGLQLILSHLKQGHLVIAHMLNGKFTRGGHYIVLGGINSIDNTVYVYDPYNLGNKNSRRKSGNGWYSFNDPIVKEASSRGGFYIIWKE